MYCLRLDVFYDSVWYQKTLLDEFLECVLYRILVYRLEIVLLFLGSPWLPLVQYGVVKRTRLGRWWCLHRVIEKKAKRVVEMNSRQGVKGTLKGWPLSWWCSSESKRKCTQFEMKTRGEMTGRRPTREWKKRQEKKRWWSKREREGRK